MQSILIVPKTDKYSIMLEDDKMLVGASSMQGWRSSMEDAHCISLTIPNLPGYRDWEGALSAVFDGHCGFRVAQTSASSILGWVTKNEKFAQGEWKQALRNAFLNGDAEMNRNLSSESSGCTANVVMMVGNKLFCANAGDSRAVLCRNGVAFPLSEDHKPNDEAEKDRVTKAGGFVLNGRVNGVLSLSRALGDFGFKLAGIPDEQQMVTANPEIRETQLQQDDEFVIQACDGIWDCMTNEQAVAFVRNELSEHGDVALSCERLMDKCLAATPAKFGTDNMTVIVLCLKSSYLHRVLAQNQAEKQQEHGADEHGGEEET